MARAVGLHRRPLLLGHHHIAQGRQVREWGKVCDGQPLQLQVVQPGQTRQRRQIGDGVIAYRQGNEPVKGFNSRQALQAPLVEVQHFQPGQTSQGSEIGSIVVPDGKGFQLG